MIVDEISFGQIVRERRNRLGLTQAELARMLVELTPAGLDRAVFSDSEALALETALKMALQYWQASGAPRKQRLLTVRNGYHGDTFAAMSVCDPVNGMHHLFREVMAQQLFAEAPACYCGQFARNPLWYIS